MLCHRNSILVKRNELEDEISEAVGHKKLAAVRLRSFEFGFEPFECLRYLGIGGFSEYEPNPKIFAIYAKFVDLWDTKLLSCRPRNSA